jgi:DNA invertase Pin-like site-specific DNA recombinase
VRRHNLWSVGTTDQDLSIQETALRPAGCGVIRAEKRSGTTTAGREQLRTVLDFLHKGDVLMVTRIDRLARNIGDLQDIVRAVRAKGATLKATEQPIDTSTAAGKCSQCGQWTLPSRSRSALRLFTGYSDSL